MKYTTPSAEKFILEISTFDHRNPESIDQLVDSITDFLMFSITDDDLDTRLEFIEVEINKYMNIFIKKELYENCALIHKMLQDDFGTKIINNMMEK